MPDTQVEIVPRQQYASLIGAMRCPVVGCEAPLSRRASEVPEIPRFHLGCTGEPMHVWRKEDLFYLKGRPLTPKEVQRAIEVYGAQRPESLV